MPRLFTQVLSGVHGQEPEGAASGALHGAEVALIQRQDVQAAVALREDHDRRAGEAEAKVGVALDNCSGAGDVA